MPSSYALTDEAQRLAIELIESGGECTDEIAERIANVDEAITDKCDRIAMVIRRLDTEAAFYASRKDAMAARASAATNAKARLRERLAAMLQAHEALTGDARVRGVEGTYSVRTVHRLVMDAEAIPDAFTKVEAKPVPDREAIRAALEAGQAVKGAALVPTLSVTIR